MTNWDGQEYRIPADVYLSLNQDTLILQSEYLSIWKTAAVGTVFELSISSFDKATGKVLENPDFSHVDLAYRELVDDEEWQLQKRLEKFKRLEAILKQEGMI
ncbi:hypothetical protein [Sphingobacterium griseoflavum]